MRIEPLSGCGLALVVSAALLAAEGTDTRVVKVDASRVENPLSPLLHGQFLEFMFEGVKGSPAFAVKLPPHSVTVIVLQSRNP